MKLQILELLIRLAILVMAGIIIPAFKKWLNTRTENAQAERIRNWAYTVVYAAEQIYNHAKKMDPDGTLRKKYAHDALIRICVQSGIEISEREIDALIEAAVLTLGSSEDGGTDSGEGTDYH